MSSNSQPLKNNIILTKYKHIPTIHRIRQQIEYLYQRILTSNNYQVTPKRSHYRICMKRGCVVMKKAILLLSALLIILVITNTACGRTPSTAPTPTPTPGSEQGAEPDDSEGSIGVLAPGGKQENPPDEPAPTATDKRSTTYGPSIFVIEASGSWQHEIDTGLYANYECELYLDKIEPHNMHDDTGSYTGVFWLKLTVDTGEYFSKFLKDVPFVDISLDAEAEGIRDNLSFYLRDGYTRDPTANFDIPDGQGGYLKPDHNALADKGSFVVSATHGNLNVYSYDSQKDILLEHQQSGASDLDVSYVIHVAPDPMREATQRDVKIHIMLPDGSSTTLDGVWRRLPGYPEDLEKYYNSGKSREILDKRQ